MGPVIHLGLVRLHRDKSELTANVVAGKWAPGWEDRI